MRLLSNVCERWWKDFVSIVLLTFAVAMIMTSWSNSYSSSSSSTGSIDYHWLASTVRGGGIMSSLRADRAATADAAMAQAAAKNHHDYGVDGQQLQLILHVGPSKTATTSLQTDLTDYRVDLLDDGYWYAGRYYKLSTNETDGTTHLDRSGESPLLTEAHNMFEKQYCQATDIAGRADCSRKFATELNQVVLRSGFRRIVLSEEPFGNRWDDPADWLAIKQALADHQEQWNVTVLVGYRRFFSWWISAHFQRERTDRSHNHNNDRWPAAGGRAKVPLFPTWWNSWTKSAYRPPHTVLEDIGDTFPVQIINLHDYEHLVSPSRMVLCEVLEAPQACAKIEQIPETILNGHDDAPSLFYDAIATEAVEAGLINGTHWSRAVVRERVRVHQEEELGLGPDDLPMKCPPVADLQALLNLSLSIESQYLPDFATSERIAEHKAEFWATNFCFVDSRRVLVTADWAAFFADLAATTNYSFVVTDDIIDDDDGP